MESEAPTQSPQYGTIPSSSNRQPRVDPRYPLHYQSGEYATDQYSNNQSLTPNDGVAHTPSRRRRPAGRVPDTLPAAPDVPRVSRGGPPLSYRDPYSNEEASPSNPVSGSGPSSRSFAARSGSLEPGIDILAGASNGTVPRRSSSQKNSRRASASEPVTSGSSQIPQPVEHSYNTGSSPSQRRRTTITSQPAEPQAPVNRIAQKQDSNPAQSPPMTSPSTVKKPPKWADDRSPLQQLEVQLNVSSKDAKRAKVQEAERRLRQQQGQPNQASQATNLAVDRSSSRRAPSQVNDIQRRGSQKQNSRGEGLARGPAQASTDPLARKSSTRTTGPTDRRSVSGPLPKDTTQRFGPPTSTRELESVSQRRSVDAGRGDSRAVRFKPEGYFDEIPPHSQHAERNDLQHSANREVQNNLGNSRVASGRGNDTAGRHGDQPDPFPREAVKSSVHGLKYEVPPQAAAGIEARQRIGFGSRIDAPIEKSGRHGHHFSDILHRGGQGNQVSRPVASAPVRHLDEWKSGDVARLMVADAVAPLPGTPKSKSDQAWWESPKSSHRRVQSGANTGMTAFDGSQEDSNGMFSPISMRRASSFSTSGDVTDDIGRGQYISQDGSAVKRRVRSWIYHPRSIARVRNVPEFFGVSYSASFISTPEIYAGGQNLYLSSHFQEPYLSKELTRSMRLVRVRVPAASTSFKPPLYLKCGPLLRYTGIKKDQVEQKNRQGTTHSVRETWRGSIMIVTDNDRSQYNPTPVLRLFHQPISLLPPPPQQFDGSNDEALPSEYVDPIGGLPKMSRTGGTVYVKPAEDLDEGKDVSRIEDDDGLFEETRTANVPTSYGQAEDALTRTPSLANSKSSTKKSSRTGRFREVKGIRLHEERGTTFWRFNIEIELGDKETRVGYRINQGSPVGFWVPARGQTMNIMFHSCNGFSMSVDSNEFSGPDPLWRDVLNSHQTKPFHVMIGGGDQIYNDAVMKQTTLFQEWLEIKNPHRKHEAEFTPEMQDELEHFYLERYAMWFSQGLFGMANSQIPMINIWDDHDIIDGFGSYPDHFMRTPVFCGLGNVAFKYYMLFQHQSVVDEVEANEPSWLLGSSPGPYINELNRSVFMSLGNKVAFLGVDCRTERTRDEILSSSSWDLVFDRCRNEIVRGETQHLIVLLGVPIAYPRLVWLENILTSRAMDPLKALGRMGVLGNFMNKFDGGVEILDDLDDHWTARNHKDERNWFVEALQDLAAEKSVRVTILGGDVHLAAIGQFYSNKKFKIPKDRDHRYMPNVVSSAIVNTPPPDMMADVLNKRNKIHHLNHETDEDMIPMFTHDVDGKPRNNKHLLPKRNWCSISEYLPGSTPPATPSTLSPSSSQETLPPSKPPGALQRTLSLTMGDKPAKLIRRLSLSQKTPSYVDPSPSPPYTPPQQQNPPQSRLVSAPLPIRPVSQFHRRPTNMSEKAAQKGGGDGAAVNLEHGLDIKLNCEIKQGDPSGSTESYRLLVPALFYDDHLEQIEHRPKKVSIIKRWNSRRQSKAATKGRTGNWGQSDSEGSNSDSDSDGENSAQNDYYGGASIPLPNAQQSRTLSARSMPPAEVPQRKTSLLRKPIPFKPRPKEDPSPQQAHASARANFPAISKPIPQAHTPPQHWSPASRSQPAPQSQYQQQQQHSPAIRSPIALNSTAPLDMDSDNYDDEDESDDYDDDFGRPQHRRGNSKFDKSGASKFFGAQAPGQVNDKEARRMSSGGTGYSGIDAYTEPKKGWRKFLPV